MALQLTYKQCFDLARNTFQQNHQSLQDYSLGLTNNMILLENFDADPRSYEEIKSDLQQITFQMLAYLPTVHIAQEKARSAIAQLQLAFAFFQQQPPLDPMTIETLRRYGFNTVRLEQKETKRVHNMMKLIGYIQSLSTSHRAFTYQLYTFTTMLEIALLKQQQQAEPHQLPEEHISNTNE